MNRKPLVLHINTVATPRNGVGQIVRAIHRDADANNFRSAIIAGRGNPQDADFILQNDIRLKVNIVRARTFLQDGFLKSRASKRCSRHIEQLKPDLVHLHNLHGYYSDLTTLKSTLDALGVPVLLTAHDFWFLTGRCAVPECGFFAHGSRVNNNLDALKCEHCKFRGAYPGKWFGTKSKLREKTEFLADCHIVTPSLYMAHFFNGKGKGEVNVIPNGIDTDIFYPNDNLSLTHNYSRILAVASKWNKAKGVDDIVRLAERLPDDWQIAMIGRNVPTHPRIIDLGYIENANEVADLIRQSDIVISASRIETYGLSVAEALACGTPVIVRSGTAAADLVTDESYIIDFSNIDDLISLLPTLSKNRIGNIETTSLWEMTKKYYELYRKLLNL